MFNNLNLWVPCVLTVVKPTVLIPALKSLTVSYSLMDDRPTTSGKYTDPFDKNLFWSVLDPLNVPIPNDELLLLSYTKGSPLRRLCGLSNINWSSAISTPPLVAAFLPSNDNSLNLFDTIGFKTAPEPLPPVIVNDKTFSISKSCWSTNTSLSSPWIIGWTNAVVPEETWGIVIDGKFITSKFVPVFNTFTLFNGP